jgi:ABC-type sugar transport system permease subunit
MQHRPTIKTRPAALPPRRWEAIAGLVFISPWLIGFILLKLIPILTAFFFSFTSFHMLRPEEMRFVGLENYVQILSDARAGASLFGSLAYFLVVVPLEMAAALGLAIAFSSQRLGFKGPLRALFFMPSVLPAIAIFSLWLGLSAQNTGWLNRLIYKPLGLPPLDSSGGLVILLMTLWSIGPGFLIMYGAMQGISRELYEAARVDGAGPFARLLSITLPMISPAIFFSLVINLTSAFGGSLLLDRGYIFSQSLSPMEDYINTVVFSQSQLGYGSALAWVLFIVVLSIVLLIFRSANRWVFFPEEHANEEI